MESLDDFYYFAKVVEHGGYAAAGRALGIPKSRLSRHVGDLETRLNVRLVNRSTRRFVVTDIGQEVYRHATAMLGEAEAARRGGGIRARRAARHRPAELSGFPGAEPAGRRCCRSSSLAIRPSGCSFMPAIGASMC